jgi:biopolymer transport protein ExbD
MSVEDSLDIKKQRTKHDGDFDITPMIDCVFLLLFFFMVTSKMDQSSTIVQPLAVNGENLAPEKLVIISAAVNANGEADFFLGNSTKPDQQVLGDAKAQEEAIGKYIEMQVSQRPDTIGILIKADGKLKEKYVTMVGKAAAAFGGGRKLYAGVQEN